MKIELDIEKTLKKLKSIRADPHLLLVIILTGLYISIFTSTCFMAYFSLGYSNDLCLQDRQIWLMSQGRIFNGILEFESEWASHHFYMILWVFLPVYVFFPTPLTLLFLQTFFLAMGAVPIYLLGKEKLNSRTAGLVFSVCYLLYPAIQNINLFEFHSIAIVTPLILWSFYFIEKNDFKKSIVFLVLAMLCKEIVALTVILLGFYTLIKNRNYKLGLTIIFLSTFWAFFTLLVLYPYMNDGGSYFVEWGSNRWAQLGNDPSEIFLNFMRNPFYTITDELSSKVEYVTGLFLPLGFLSFLHPSTLLVVAHEFLLVMSSSQSVTMYSLHNHYSAITIPFIFISAIYGVSFVVRFLRSKFRLNYTLYMILSAILITGVISNMWYSAFPITGYSDHLDMAMNFEISDHSRIVFEMIDEIPKNSTLVVQSWLCPPASHKKKVFQLRNYVHRVSEIYDQYYIENIPDYVLVDKTRMWDDRLNGSFFENRPDEYFVYKSEDGIILYKHV